MLIAKEFHIYLANIYSSNTREDFLFLEENWGLYSTIYSSILTKGEAILERVEPNIRKQLVRFMQIGEVIASDLLCSKLLLNNGFLTQSAAMSRPSMETGLILSILVSLNRLSDWLDGHKIKVPIRQGKESKEIGQCTYGNLIDAFNLLINSDEDLLVHERFSEFQELPIADLANGILNIHKDYMETINTNKYIHKGQEVLNFQRWLFRNYLMFSQSEVADDRELFQTMLLDLHFELYSILIQCLMGQAASRFIEFIQLISDLNIEQYADLRNDLVDIGARYTRNYTNYQKGLENHMANWQSRQDKLEVLSNM